MQILQFLRKKLGDADWLFFGIPKVSVFCESNGSSHKTRFFSPPYLVRVLWSDSVPVLWFHGLLFEDFFRRHQFFGPTFVVSCHDHLTIAAVRTATSCTRKTRCDHVWPKSDHVWPKSDHVWFSLCFSKEKHSNTEETSVLLRFS